MALINVMEKLVDDKIKEMLKGEKCCKCEQCVEDMKAKALNQLPAKYVSSHNGELFSKLDAANRQNSVNLNIAVANAIQCIASRPSHPPRPSAAELTEAAAPTAEQASAEEAETKVEETASAVNEEAPAGQSEESAENGAAGAEPDIMVG